MTLSLTLSLSPGLGTGGTLSAATSPDGSTSEKSFFTSVYEDHFKPSLRGGFDGVGASILLGGALATALAKQHDEEIRRDFKDNQKMNKDFARFGSIWGSGAPGIAIAATQLAFDPEHGMPHAEAIAFTSLSHVSLVLLARRSRPYDQDVKTSFPSGHSASAWATATSLSYAYGWPLAVPTYSAALLTMASRLTDDRHWLSDTIAGATLGLFWGRATSLHPHLQAWNIQPFWSLQGSFGIGMRHAF